VSERVALVTGAAGAIGGAIVRRLADDGYTAAGVAVAVGADKPSDLRNDDHLVPQI
jgi:NAD(P)-dependent dehydrogenase (short-subunit alcohol dehydrogenase family)